MFDVFAAYNAEKMNATCFSSSQTVHDVWQILCSHGTRFETKIKRLSICVTLLFLMFMMNIIEEFRLGTTFHFRCKLFTCS